VLGREKAKKCVLFGAAGDETGGFKH
jgi:hypothetical protein